MRRLTTLAAAAALTAASLATPALAAPAAKTGYYVIRWENTGICQIWNTELQSKPLEWPSSYKIVSKPVPTFVEATNIQLKLRDERRCFL
ncbi:MULTISPECIES: hypothetical protein [Bradyrhizobium]|uniref:hypothetical protein n=2 Tax=Nitrobacteraceae TaxID=41294 RepID=UPI00005DD494|nr:MULTISPECIES: hypothetical protein [Bradyrhizobium]ABQ38152.1 putative exported protein of unknown function [Bradyrhizobium sp. BTAi1]MCL8484028.1 hypothetical protein [Bradyrhizobium denitrificans]RTL98360.1 MAG: hypothetical protein EKK32_19170 [Bradyrhizobiaceae bacterium]